MPKLKFLVSLITQENDYQQEQARAAQAAGQRAGVDIHIVYAENDRITQSTQILKQIQATVDHRPAAIIVEPVGATALPHVAQAAVDAKIGWAVLTQDVAYLAKLRDVSSTPVFGVGSDQIEVGRIQGRQTVALLPQGVAGSVLYITGPSHSEAALQREIGMREIVPKEVHLTVLKGQWTEESAKKCVLAWLKLSTSQKTAISVVVAQNDAMAVGAKKAFDEISNLPDRERFGSIPRLGCDGAPNTGQAWLTSGLLTATVLTPPSAGKAVELMAEAIAKRGVPLLRTLTPVSSIPPVNLIRRSR
jgi:ABC-type sugar transport system substrate-binding protein